MRQYVLDGAHVAHVATQPLVIGQPHAEFDGRHDGRRGQLVPKLCSGMRATSAITVMPPPGHT